MSYTVRAKLDEWYETGDEKDFDKFVGITDEKAFIAWVQGATDSDEYDCWFCLMNFGNTGCSLDYDE
jgi:hypothetical protein